MGERSSPPMGFPAKIYALITSRQVFSQNSWEVVCDGVFLITSHMGERSSPPMGFPAKIYALISSQQVFSQNSWEVVCDGVFLITSHIRFPAKILR
jgi:hypothetical protein